MNAKNRTSSRINGLIFIVCYCHLAAGAWAGVLGSSLDRRYDQNTYLASHNAFANVEDGYNPLLANQLPGISHQLEIGVRCLLLDTWFMRERVVVDPVLHLPLHMESEIYEKRNDYTNTSWTGSPAVVLAHGAAKPFAGYTLLDGYPLIVRSYKPFVDGLKQLKHWMDDNPQEVITLVLESYVPEPSFMDSCFYEAGLAGMIFLPNFPNPGMTAGDGTRWNVPVHGWPRLRQLVENNKRLVVFSSNGVRWKRYSGQPINGAATTDDDGQPYQWDFMVENEPGESGLTETGVGSARSESKSLKDMSYPLTFMNWFPKVPSTSQSDVLNDYWVLSAARDRFANSAGRYPNFIALDHCQSGLGGPQLVVQDCNAYWAARAIPRIKFLLPEWPNSDGWYAGPVTLTAVAVVPEGRKVKFINSYWYGGYFVNYAEATNSWPFEPARLVSVPISPSITEGIFHVSADAVDDLGARSDRALMTFKVDTTPPLVGPIQITRPPDGAGEWYNKPLTARLRVADLLSGPHEGGWLKANGEIVASQSPVAVVTTNQPIEGYYDFLYEQEGATWVWFYGTDFAGHSASNGIHISLDLHPPITSVETGPFRGGVTVSLSAVDNLSGMNGTWYRMDDEASWTAYTGPWDIPGTNTHTLEFFSKDVAGNTEPVQTYYLNRAFVSLASSRNPAGYYQPLELTAAIVVDYGQTATGMVTFLDGTNVMGSAKVGANRLAQLTNNPINYLLTKGPHLLRAFYVGGATFGSASSQVLTQNVVDPPPVRLTSSVTNLVQTQPVTFMAEISPGGALAATGSVTIEGTKSSGRSVFRAILPLDSTGRASVLPPPLPPGEIIAFAYYSGDANFPSNSSPALVLNVTNAELIVSISTSPNPSILGQPVTGTLNVDTTPGAIYPDIVTVSVNDRDELIQTLPMNGSRQVSFTTSSFALGDHYLVGTVSSFPQLDGGTTLAAHTVLDSPVLAPAFRRILTHPTQGVTLQIDVQAGQPVLVQTSSNLFSWADFALGTNTDTVLRLADPVATNSPLRFYRARLVQ